MDAFRSLLDAMGDKAVLKSRGQKSNAMLPLSIVTKLGPRTTKSGRELRPAMPPFDHDATTCTTLTLHIQPCLDTRAALADLKKQHGVGGDGDIKSVLSLNISDLMKLRVAFVMAAPFLIPVRGGGRSSCGRSASDAPHPAVLLLLLPLRLTHLSSLRYPTTTTSRLTSSAWC